MFPILVQGFKRFKEFHHGDCVGVDDQAASMIWFAGGTKVVSHPPVNNSKRAFSYSHEERPAKDYLVRNIDIVDETELLIVIPKEDEEVLRSGTWATFRYAKSIKRPIFVIKPDGDLEFYNMEGMNGKETTDS